MLSDRSRGVQALALGALCALVMNGCSAGSDEHPAGLGDCNDPNCAANPGGSTGSGSKDASTESGSDAASGGTPVAVSGSVVSFVDSTFSQVDPYLGTGSVRVPTPLGDQTLDLGADGGAGFSSSSISSGQHWFAVFPTGQNDFDGGLQDSFLPTYSLLTVPAQGTSNLQVPVMSQLLMSSLYAGIAQAPSLRADAAQVVLVFEQAGQRLSDVSLTEWPTSDLVAYDQGLSFSSEATATGSMGTVILVNTTGARDVTWSWARGASGRLTVLVVPGWVSFVRIEVPV